MEKQIIFSGVQPSGDLTVGNYIGAMRNWVTLQEREDTECLYCVVDLHAITVRQDPAELRWRTYEVVALMIACGLSPEQNILFVQSHVHEHAALAWVLNCFTYIGELNRMTQFKDKSRKQGENINVGLLDYPVLMASDILLYQTGLVPVGHDQKQHLELARDIAIRVNNLYEGLFVVPEPYIPPVGARIMSLLDPTAKMSKSDENENSIIRLLDAPDVIRKKFRRAVTDTVGKIQYTPEQPGVANLLDITAALTGQSVAQIVTQLQDSGYGKLKQMVTDATIAVLEPIQRTHAQLMEDVTYLDDVMRAGADKARQRAQRTLRRVYDAVGFILPAQ